MCIKIFTSDDPDDLERGVNDWIREQGGMIEIMEMRFACTIDEFSVALLAKWL